MKLQNGYKIIYSKRDKDGVEHFYAGKGTFPSEKDDVLVMAAGNKVVYGGDKDEEVIIADGVTLEDLKEITENGEYDIANFARVKVNVSGLQPTGTLNIDANGEYDVTEKAAVDVNVPIPEGYIKPSGYLNITENDDYDVTAFATAYVNIPQPSGTIEESLTQSQDDWSGSKTIDVTDYETLELSYDFTPSGTTYCSLSLSAGDSGSETINVAGYEEIEVSYEVAGGSYKNVGYAADGVYTFIGSGYIYCEQGYGSVALTDETEGMSVGESKEIGTGDGHLYTLTRTQ